MPYAGSADDQTTGAFAIDALIDGLHQDAHEGNFQTTTLTGTRLTKIIGYFTSIKIRRPDNVFLGTDKSERWTIEEFKVYAEPAFEDGHGWTYSVKERNWEGDGNTRWFDEVDLLNEKLGHCRGTGVVELHRCFRVENRPRWMLTMLQSPTTSQREVIVRRGRRRGFACCPASANTARRWDLDPDGSECDQNNKRRSATPASQ